jgi:serine/threonine-protein kinase RsbW
VPFCQFHISNQVSELHHVRTLLEAFFELNSLNSELAAEMMLVAEELIANIIEHGYHDHLYQRIDVELALDQQRNFSLRITDVGIPFNPLIASKAGTDKSPGEFTAGGLGISLILALSDQQHYQYQQGKNIVSIVKSTIGS